MDPAVDRSALELAAEAACRAGLRAGLREPDARDLAQEALVRALSTAPPPLGVPLAAWVYGIAKNLGRDHKKSARSREVLVDAVPEALTQAAPGTAVDEELVTVLAVRRALHALPEPLRDVVTLHELEDHSLRETAAALAIPFDTAKDRLRRGREQLRERLGDPGSAYGHERAHSRRRAATAAGAVVAAVVAALGEHRATAGTTVGAGAGGRLVVRTWLAALAGSALVVGGFAAGRLTAPPPPRAPAPIALASSPPSAPPPTAPAPDSPITASPQAAPVAARRPIAQPSAPPIDAAPPAPSADHEAERLVLDRARAALQRGLPDEAIVTLMSHARQFPNGTLGEERDVLLIEAYVRANNLEVARRRIQDYRGHYPTGALRARVDALDL
jgi:RNA polymerase sigma factor (sigma-70 family)